MPPQIHFGSKILVSTANGQCEIPDIVSDGKFNVWGPMMSTYLRFLMIGLVLGLFTEFLLKLVAGINPPAFIIALCAYPVILSLVYMGGRLLDRMISSRWRADVLFYIASGLGGLAIEWVLLGNGPRSNAFQLGMVAMWTTFCFGPRVLIRYSAVIQKSRRRFWIAFGIVGFVLTAIVLLGPSRDARVVIAVFGLSGTYLVWSIWLLFLAWRTRQSGACHEIKRDGITKRSTGAAAGRGI